MIEVSVPATSANLGPGYDCLGLALSYYGIFQFQMMKQGIQITGCPEEFQNSKNLVYRSFRNTLDYMHEDITGIHIHIDSDIPLARGLGSSAACVVAGAIGANALFQERLSKEELFQLCTQMEGHPDNVAPALFGSLSASFMDGDRPHMVSFAVHPSLYFLTMIPQVRICTQQARSILPDRLSYQQAVDQMGRCCAMAKAIECKDMQMIHMACRDMMHEPYRKQLIPHFDEIKELCMQEGAAAVFISGSGSTMIAVMDEREMANTVKPLLEKKYDITVKLLQSDPYGASVKEV